jgi:hypothetical protein
MLEQFVQNTFFNAAQCIEIAAVEWGSPHAVMRPQIFPDGTQWCALYGEDLQSGVAGFGATPGDAAADFDKNWRHQTLKRPA